MTGLVPRVREDPTHTTLSANTSRDSHSTGISVLAFRLIFSCTCTSCIPGCFHYCLMVLGAPALLQPVVATMGLGGWFRMSHCASALESIPRSADDREK